MVRTQLMMEHRNIITLEQVQERMDTLVVEEDLVLVMGLVVVVVDTWLEEAVVLEGIIPLLLEDQVLEEVLVDQLV